MAVTVASGKKGTFKGTSAIDTFIINDDTKGATLTNIGGGDIIAIEGFAADFTAKASGRVVTLTSIEDKTLVIKFQLAATAGTASIRFLDGDLTATYTGTTKKVTLGAQALTSKAATVSDAALGASDSVATFDETAGGGSSSTGTTFTLTTGTDSGAAFTGGAGNDTFAGLSAATAAAATDTLTVLDIIDGGDGTDRLDIVVQATNTDVTDGAQITNVETIAIRGTAATGTVATYAAGAGVTKIIANLSTQDITATGLAAGGVYEVHGNAVVANGITLAGYAAAATAGTLNITDGVTAGAVTVSGTGLLSQTINSTGGGATGNVIGALALAGTTTSATVNATTALTTGTLSNTGGNVITSLTVTGAGAVALGTTIPATVTTLNASAMTGALTATLANTAAQVVTLGSGNDVITTGGVLTTGSVAAGTGTDTLIIAGNVAHVNTAALGAKYTGFETLRLNGTMNMATTLSGITAVELTAATNSITNMTATQAAAVKAQGTTIGATTLTLATATGTSDVLTLTLGTGLTTAAAAATGVLTATGFETINLVENGGATATAGANRTSVITGAIVDTSLATVNLTGRAFSLTDISNANANALTINGSALTGDGDTISTGLTVGGNASAGSTITGSAVRDLLTMGAEGSTYNGAAGNDTITTAFANLVADGATDATVIGGTGNDTLAISNTTNVVLADNHFTNVSGMELLTVVATAGDLAITTGGAFNAAYATGVTMTTGVLAAGADAIINMGLYGQAATVTVTATDSVGTAAETNNILTGSGADIVTFTGDNTFVGVTGDAAQGSIAISTRGGADTISFTHGQLLANALGAGTATAVSITGGTGADTITKGVGSLNSTTITSVTSFIMAAGDSGTTGTARDNITNFQVAGVAANTLSDVLNFEGTAAVSAFTATVDSGTITSHAFAAGAGLVTFDDAATFATALVINASNLADVVGYLNTNLAANGSVMFVYDSDSSGTADATIVFHQGSATAVADDMVELVGITGTVLTITATATAAGSIVIA